ncbi:hypothetical protein RND71_025199 [Anisodus tanguticus]|uniref:F-box associated beta-propeller type 1 domain-containing protein n=1 Tax=Anisodus tanguticus TaxID=243964 RepID=A0AAE1V4M1_9SOLA|nr:hypothetical protein RND71_025199 [Anisodus tanguticus]
MYCCYDGLVLLGVVDRFDEQLLLWNPSIRESLVLPHPKFTLSESTFGLGFDATSDDYKILKIHPNDRLFPKPSSVILALKSGSWRRNCNPPNGSSIPLRDSSHLLHPLVFVHGAFHWVGFGQYYRLVSFSISNEV